MLHYQHNEAFPFSGHNRDTAAAKRAFDAMMK
jgi:hypothetical protein